jgi:sugar/nucleoside kinase (ribokinase family)
MNQRSQIATRTADLLEQAQTQLTNLPVVLGYDGFVDEIIEVVDKRIDFENHTGIEKIEVLAEKVQAASGRSSNFELVVKTIKLGGNGPIMANALAAAGLPVTYLGSLGYPALHPVFEELASRSTVHSIAEPGHTDALEFADGKLMLGKLHSMKEITWQNLLDRVGLETLIECYDRSRLVAAVNWTMVPHMEGIWQGLADHVLPKLSDQKRIFFIDLADPEKRTMEDKARVLQALKAFRPFGEVILGLNLKEALQVMEVLGLPEVAEPEAAIEQMSGRIRKALDIQCVVVHPRSGAAADVEGESASFRGPLVHEPKISTGGGDHFNAGFCLGRLLGMPVAESLCLGTATSGYYVRSAVSPSGSQLVPFLRALPEPE